jgi:hypothetical protein
VPSIVISNISYINNRFNVLLVPWEHAFNLASLLFSFIYNVHRFIMYIININNSNHTSILIIVMRSWSRISHFLIVGVVLNWPSWVHYILIWLVSLRTESVNSADIKWIRIIRNISSSLPESCLTRLWGVNSRSWPVISNSRYAGIYIVSSVLISWRFIAVMIIHIRLKWYFVPYWSLWYPINLCSSIVLFDFSDVSISRIQLLWVLLLPLHPISG